MVSVAVRVAVTTGPPDVSSLKTTLMPSGVSSNERIATIWNVLLRGKLLKQITPTEVTAMMIGLKLARLAEDMHKDDSWVDIIGYAALGGEISNDDQSTSA